MSTMALDMTQAKRLQTYYLIRAGFSLVWLLLALSFGKASAVVGAVLLVLYPAWDALANFLDAKQSGGLKHHGAQQINAFLSLGVALAIGLALAFGTDAAIVVFGLWAMAAGLLQLAAAVRRWQRSGGQWPMVVSGAQSALAGGFFVKQATDGVALDVSVVAPYAAFGAFYFIVSAVWLAVQRSRRPEASKGA